MIVRFVLIFACVLLHLCVRAAAHRVVLAAPDQAWSRPPAGDLVAERKRFNIYVPLMTSMLISTAATFVLSAALWLGSQR
jgi:hypothetical protein